MSQTAKLFKNGAPPGGAAFRPLALMAQRCMIGQNAISGDVLCSAKPQSLDRFFAALAEGRTTGGFPGSCRAQSEDQRARSPRGFG